MIIRAPPFLLRDKVVGGCSLALIKDASPVGTLVQIISSKHADAEHLRVHFSWMNAFLEELCIPTLFLVNKTGLKSSQPRGVMIKEHFLHYRLPTVRDAWPLALSSLHTQNQESAGIDDCIFVRVVDSGRAILIPERMPEPFSDHLRRHGKSFISAGVRGGVDGSTLPCLNRISNDYWSHPRSIC